MFILTGMGSNHLKPLLAFEPGKNRGTTSAECWGLRQEKTDARDLPVWRAEVKCQGASLSTSGRTHTSWEQFSRLLFDPLKSKCAYGPLAEPPTSGQGRKDPGMRKTSFRIVFTLTSYVQTTRAFSPTKKNGCSPMKWHQTPLLHLRCCPCPSQHPLPSTQKK